MTDNHNGLEKMVDHGLMIGQFIDAMDRYQEIESYRQDLEEAGFEPAIFTLSPIELIELL